MGLMSTGWRALRDVESMALNHRNSPQTRINTGPDPASETVPNRSKTQKLKNAKNRCASTAAIQKPVRQHRKPTRSGEG